ncbi:hypothetical protein [Chondrinema litorale]|uniref:hypothetical protein n=1 Tax=Chondrinema litorale TaxID=2994555 RepID=UPI00254317DE|nr:hypothetical protein [Chondrinema litorale]UZR93118.1 hypothetical protein OQ292_14755 [Chondrinema litorale]
MIRIAKYILVLFTAGLIFASCDDVSDMAIDRVASPVLIINGSPAEDETTFEITSVIYELDKSGILDQNVGIDSIPLPGLVITVTAVGSSRTVIDELTTDSNGEIILTKPIGDLDDISSLEWTGEYKDQSFTKIQNL